MCSVYLGGVSAMCLIYVCLCIASLCITACCLYADDISCCVPSPNHVPLSRLLVILLCDIGMGTARGFGDGRGFGSSSDIGYGLG